jgi:hypothetical protein
MDGATCISDCFVENMSQLRAEGFRHTDVGDQPIAKE